MHLITLVKVIKEGKSYNVTLGSRFTLSQVPRAYELRLACQHFISIQCMCTLSCHLICSNYSLFAATLFFCINFILFATTFSFAACPLWATIIIWFLTLQNSDSLLSVKCSVLHLHFWPWLFQKVDNATLYIVGKIVYPVDNAIGFPYTYLLDSDLFSG